MSESMSHLAPMTDDLLRLALRGLALPARPRVADLCCGTGAASLLMAREYQAVCTGVDRSETLVRTAREASLAQGFQEEVEFIEADARHVDLPSASFDLVLALGGSLTYIGRGEGLERIRLLLRPGGALLLSDLIYLDSPAPEEVERFIRDQAPDCAIRSLFLEPAVRAVYEEGLFRFETEHSYRQLLALHGYETLFSFHAPESAWNAYYAFAARAQTDPGAAVRIPVGVDELAAFYCWGGRWGAAYLVLGARIPEESGTEIPS